MMNETCSAECISAYCTDEGVRAQGLQHACSQVNGIKLESEAVSASLFGVGMNGMRALQMECRNNNCESLDGCFAPRLSDADYKARMADAEAKQAAAAAKKKKDEEEDDSFVQIAASTGGANVAVVPSGDIQPIRLPTPKLETHMLETQTPQARKVGADSTKPVNDPSIHGAAEVMARRSS